METAQYMDTHTHTHTHIHNRPMLCTHTIDMQGSPAHMHPGCVHDTALCYASCVYTREQLTKHGCNADFALTHTRIGNIPIHNPTCLTLYL